MDEHANQSWNGPVVADPVCGMEIDRAEAEGREPFGERTFYFCSARCLAQFRAEPGRFVARAREREQRA